METIKLWARNGAAVRQAIEVGELVHLETASEELTDALLLVAIPSDLLAKWAAAFPELRCEPEISMEVLLASHVAARFAGRYSRRNSGDVLRAAAVLGAVGSSIEVVEPELGLSWRGTSDGKLSSGDVLRKLWVQLAQHVALNEPLRRPPCEQSQAVKVRQRAARRAVKGAVNVAEAEARAPRVAAKLLAWYHDKVGPWLFAYAQGGKGRRLQIVDTTHVEGPLATGTYEDSGVVTNDDGSRSRGDKLATWRNLLGSGGTAHAGGPGAYSRA